jgi:hypothetical protein
MAPRMTRSSPGESWGCERRVIAAPKLLGLQRHLHEASRIREHERVGPRTLATWPGFPPAALARLQRPARSACYALRACPSSLPPPIAAMTLPPRIRFNDYCDASFLNALWQLPCARPRPRNCHSRVLGRVPATWDRCKSHSDCRSSLVSRSPVIRVGLARNLGQAGCDRQSTIWPALRAQGALSFASARGSRL